jgi:Methylamine utilisation protein MauE
MRALAALVELGLGLVFVAAAVGKLLAHGRFRASLLLSGLVPPALVPATVRVLPPLELATGLLLLSGALHPLGPVVAIGLLVAFTARAWPLLRSGRAMSCSCFGTAGEFVDAGLVARNAVLIGYGLVGALWGPPGRPGLLDTAADGAVGTVALAGVLLAPFLIAQAVSLWAAAPRLASLPSLPGGGRAS